MLVIAHGHHTRARRRRPLAQRAHVSALVDYREAARAIGALELLGRFGLVFGLLGEI
jgi:hypothetical protein